MTFGMGNSIGPGRVSGIPEGPRFRCPPSGRTPPSVTSRCRYGGQFVRDPCAWRQATLRTTSSGVPVRVRTAAVTVRAAPRAISPSRRRRDRQEARSRLADGVHHPPVRHGREARGVQPPRPDREAAARQLGQQSRHVQAKASNYSCAPASQRMRANLCSSTPRRGTSQPPAPHVS